MPPRRLLAVTSHRGPHRPRRPVPHDRSVPWCAGSGCAVSGRSHNGQDPAPDRRAGDSTGASSANSTGTVRGERTCPEKYSGKRKFSGKGISLGRLACLTGATPCRKYSYRLFMSALSISRGAETASPDKDSDRPWRRRRAPPAGSSSRLYEPIPVSTSGVMLVE